MNKEISYANTQCRLDEELDRFIAMMDIPDCQLRIINCNESLGLTNEKDTRLLARSLTEEQYRNSWHYLNDLGGEYHEFIQKGYGGNNEKHPRQSQIEEELSKKLQPWLLKIASAITNGSGWCIRTNQGSKLLSLKGSPTPLEDLVQEGAIGILKGLQKYDPKEGKLSTYITMLAATTMYRAGIQDMGLFRLPVPVVSVVKPIMNADAGKTATIAKIQEVVGVSALQAIAIYHGFKRTWVDIYEHYTTRHGGHKATFEERFLKDTANDFLPCDNAVVNELYDRITDLIKTALTPREEIVVRRRFGFEQLQGEEETLETIGKDLGVSRQRILQIEVRALSKLRRKLRWLAV
ncbi:sigma-70 family RNA polymerase sigma factor [Candidatus Woesearchaeota archaeon]|nr:sigma-70 family RNA polymerase sigma factor [Candidatus Woesearchaeota archaeon]